MTSVTCLLASHHFSAFFGSYLFSVKNRAIATEKKVFFKIWKICVLACRFFRLLLLPWRNIAVWKKLFFWCYGLFNLVPFSHFAHNWMLLSSRLCARLAFFCRASRSSSAFGLPVFVCCPYLSLAPLIFVGLLNVKTHPIATGGLKKTYFSNCAAKKPKCIVAGPKYTYMSRKVTRFQLEKQQTPESFKSFDFLCLYKYFLILKLLIIIY